MPPCTCMARSAASGPPLNGCDKITRRAKFRLTRRANHLYDSRHPVPEEGALAIVTERWDGMWWTRRHRARDGMAERVLSPVSDQQRADERCRSVRRSRVVLTPQRLASSLAEVRNARPGLACRFP